MYPGPERPQRGARPYPTIKIKKEQITPWLAAESEITGWCFFRAANVALADGEFWAVNGIARGRVGANRITCNGKPADLLDGWAGSEDRTAFSAAINDAINKACPD